MNIWKSYILNADKDMKTKAIFAVMKNTWAVVKIRPEKNSDLFRIWTHDLYCSSSVHYCKDHFRIHYKIHLLSKANAMKYLQLICNRYRTINSATHQQRCCTILNNPCNFLCIFLHKITYSISQNHRIPGQYYTKSFFHVYYLVNTIRFFLGTTTGHICIQQ